MILYNTNKNNSFFKLEREDEKSIILSTSNITGKIIFPVTYLKGDEDFVSMSFKVKYRGIEGYFYIPNKDNKEPREEIFTKSCATQVILTDTEIPLIAESLQVEINFNGGSNKLGTFTIYIINSRS